MKILPKKALYDYLINLKTRNMKNTIIKLMITSALWIPIIGSAQLVKTNINNFNALAKIKTLNPVSYNFTNVSTLKMVTLKVNLNLYMKMVN